MHTRLKTLWSKIKDTIIPLKKNELGQFFPPALLFFCIIFNYKILINVKDTLIINSSGPATISFLKLYLVTPCSMLVVLLYMKISNHLSHRIIFNYCISLFGLFFFIFNFVLYPNVESLHFSTAKIEKLYLKFPNFRSFIDIFAHWSYSIFYIMAEIWSSFVIPIMFWQFVNQISTIAQAKRFFVLFSVLGNLAPVATGAISSLIYKVTINASNQWDLMLKNQVSFTVLVCGIILYLYNYIHRHLVSDDVKIHVSLPSKAKIGIIESFKLIGKSKQLILIALLIASYGINMNFLDIQWKNQLRIYCNGNSAKYYNFMLSYYSILGIIGTLFGWTIGTGLLRKLSWIKSALVTPVVFSAGGIFLFTIILLKGTLTCLASTFVLLAVYIGSGVIMISKIIKFSMFDTTKEIAYMSLNRDLLVKGKAAIEVIGGRFGKAFASFIQSFLLSIFATKDVLIIAPYTFIFYIITLVVWFYAVTYLNKNIKPKEIK